MTVTALNIPPGVPSNGMVRVDFVPAGGFDDHRYPTAAEVKAASAQHLTAHIFPVAPSATVQRKEKRRMGSTQAYELLGANQWTIEDLEYVYDVQSPESLTHEAYAALTPGTTGYLVYRWAAQVGLEVADGQIVDVYPVRLGPQNKMPPEADDELVVRQPVAIIGDVVSDVELGSSPASPASPTSPA